MACGGARALNTRAAPEVALFAPDAAVGAARVLPRAGQSAASVTGKDAAGSAARVLPRASPSAAAFEGVVEAVGRDAVATCAGAAPAAPVAKLAQFFDLGLVPVRTLAIQVLPTTSIAIEIGAIPVLRLGLILAGGAAMVAGVRPLLGGLERRVRTKLAVGEEPGLYALRDARQLRVEVELHNGTQELEADIRLTHPPQLRLTQEIQPGALFAMLAIRLRAKGIEADAEILIAIRCHPPGVETPRVVPAFGEQGRIGRTEVGAEHRSIVDCGSLLFRSRSTPLDDTREETAEVRLLLGCVRPAECRNLVHRRSRLLY